MEGSDRGYQAKELEEYLDGARRDTDNEANWKRVWSPLHGDGKSGPGGQLDHIHCWTGASSPTLLWHSSAFPPYHLLFVSPTLVSIRYFRRTRKTHN
ncbi:hypothetical protein RSAG8_02807, partial [Rhizoctonia solani AG-8 WAC10335]